MDGFDVVPVGIEHERAVVVLRVFGSQAGSTVIASAGRERRRVEGIDLLASIGGKGNVRPTDDVARRDGEIGCVLETEGDLVCAFSPWTDLRKPQRSQRPTVELTTASEIADTHADVIDDDAAPWHLADCTADPRGTVRTALPEPEARDVSCGPHGGESARVWASAIRGDCR